MITPNSKYMMREEQEQLQKNKELINSASASSLVYDKNRLKNVQFQEKFEKEILVSTNQIQRKNKVLYSQSQQSDINNNNNLHKSSSSALVLSSKNILQSDLQNFDKYKDVHSDNYENLMKIGIIKQKEFKEPPNLKDKTEQVKRIQEIQSQMTNLTPLAKDGDYDVITDHKSMMREHRKDDFSSDKISTIILNYYPRIMGEQQIFFRIDLIDNIPPEYWSIQFMMGLLLKISDKKSTLFRQKHKQVITTNSESIKFNNCVLGYKDELNIIKNPDFYLYFEINGVKSDNTTEKLAWTVQPLFNARGEIIFGKFKLPFYTFTQKVTTQLHLKLRQTYKPQLYYWVAKEESQQFKENKLISKNQYHIGKLHQLIQEQQNKTSQVDVPRIMKYAENTTDYILGMPDTDVGDINNLRGQIVQRLDKKIDQLLSLNKFEKKLQKNQQKLDKLQYLKKIIQMTKEEKFEDKNPTYTWQYPVAEYWDIPFILKKQSVSLEFGYKNHFSIKKKKMEKTLMQVIEEKEEDNEKYKPEEHDINYFDKGDLENQNKNDQFFNKNKKLVIEGEEKKKKKNKNNQGENQEDSENENKQEKQEEDSDEYKTEKQINVKEFEPNEDYFDHRQMQNLDDLLDRNQEDGSAYPTYNNLYSNQTSRMGTQIRNGKTIIINGSQYGNKSYTSIYPNSKRTTKRLQTTMTNQSRRTGTSKKTMIGNQTNFPDDMDQYGNFLYFKKKPKDFTRLDKLRGNRNPDESYSEQGDLSESENNSQNQSQFGNFQQRKVKSRQQTVIKEDISEMNFSKNQLDNTNMENSQQQEYIQEKILHPYDVQKTYAKEVLKRQGAKQYDEHRNSYTESVDSWASQNDWATLKKRDYYYKQREFAGPQTPSIFQSSTNSWHKSGELFFLPPQQQQDYNREELNDLWHDLFGDLTEQHKKDKQKEFQEIIREGKKKLEAFPKPLPNFFFVVHFLKNFKHQKINLRVAIVKDDTYLSIGQNEIIIHKEIHGQTNVKRSKDKAEYFQLEIDYQTILPLDLQHLKQFFTPKELLNMQLFVTFFDKDGVKGWFFHPLYVEDQELVKQNAPRKQLEKYEGSQFLKPTYGNFQVNLFGPPMQKPPFNNLTKFSELVLNFTIKHRNTEINEVQKFDLEKYIPPDSGNRLFITILEINDFKNNKNSVQMKAELFNKKTNQIVEDRNGDLCQLEEESVKPTVLREKQSFFYEQLYFDLNETDILESNCGLQFKFWDYQDKYLGQLNFDLISKEGKLNLGEIFQQTVNVKGKKQKRKLRFLVEMKPFQLVLDEYSKKSSIQITMKKIGNYMDNYEMAYSFSFNKDSLILSDDYDFPIQYQSPEFFQPDNMRQVSFNNIQMAVPINPNRMKLKYYNALFKLNIQFKFTVKVDSQKFVQELFAWYAHPLFNCVDKKFNTGIFDVQLFALPVAEENFYETRFQRIPVRFQFRIDVVNTDQIEALRQYEAKTTVFSNIIVSKPEEKVKEQFTIVIHCLKNTKKPYNINFGLLDPYYVEDDNGNLCNFEVDPETVDEEIQIVDYNCVTKIEINTREYAQRNIDNLQNNHLFFIMRDMKNKKQKVDYWVYIRLFDENMQFRYGDFIERVYVAPLVQPEDIDKQYNNLVLSDVEIHYSLGRYDKEQSFLEEKEYESETNSVLDEENSQNSSYQNLLRNGQRLAYERQQNKNQSQSQTQSQSQYDDSNGMTKTNLSELNDDEILERQYGKFLQQKKEMGQKNQDSEENDYQEEDDTFTENQQKSQQSSNFTQSKSNLSDIRRYNYKGQVQDQINQSRQSQNQLQNTSYYSNQSFIEKQQPKQFRNNEISAFQSLNPQNKNQYTNNKQAMEYNNDNFAEQYKNDGAISVPRNQFDQIRKNEIQRTIAQVGKYNYSSNYEPGQRNDKKNPIQNQSLAATSNVVSSKNTSKYSLGSDIRDGQLKDFL